MLRIYLDDHSSHGSWVLARKRNIMVRRRASMVGHGREMLPYGAWIWYEQLEVALIMNCFLVITQVLTPDLRLF